MLSWDMRSYHIAEQSTGPVFFDRGVVDVVGYLRLLGLTVPKHMEDALEMFRYNQRVFIAPPWEKIYEQDRERKQDFKQALRTYEAIMTVYTERGHERIELPLASVEARLRFVLHAIGSAQ
jgi:predicted ATPase